MTFQKASCRLHDSGLNQLQRFSSCCTVPSAMQPLCMVLGDTARPSPSISSRRPTSWRSLARHSVLLESQLARQPLPSSSYESLKFCGIKSISGFFSLRWPSSASLSRCSILSVVTLLRMFGTLRSKHTVGFRRRAFQPCQSSSAVS